MKALFFLCCFLLATTGSIMAQSNGQGKVEIIADHRLDQLMQLYHDTETRNPTIPGYRIQIFSDGNRSEAQKAKERFYTQVPDKKPFIVYQAPNFKLRIGNYRSRLDAYKDLLDISVYYSNAFIVKEEIALTDL